MAWSKEPDNVEASFVRAAALAALLAGAVAPVGAQGIYTCVDAKGRRLTADRPIVECLDREQTELSSGGLPRRKIAPMATAAERVAEEEKARVLEEERIRVNEEKKRERALVNRYPNRGVHNNERAEALALVDSVTGAAQRRTKELLLQRKFLEGELEFYQSNPSRMPTKLRRQVDEVEAQLAAQQRFLADQDVEKVRVNARFDEELSRLTVLWVKESAAPTIAARAASAPAAKPASAAKAAKAAAR